MGGVNAAKSSSSDQEALRVADAVTVTYIRPKISPGRPHVVLEWEGGALGDMTADAVVATILQVCCLETSRTTAYTLSLGLSASCSPEKQFRVFLRISHFMLASIVFCG